jgi:hypothetical protein
MKFNPLTSHVVRISATALVCAAVSHAATITLDQSGYGTYRNDGFNNYNNASIVAGFCIAAAGCAGDNTAGTFRDFFVFDLSGITDTITAAKLRIFNDDGGYQGARNSMNTYTLFDVTSDIDKVTTSHAAGSDEGKGIYNDLGTGTTYGSRIVSAGASLNNAVVEILVNSDGVAALDAATGKFAFGGAITTLSGTETVNTGMFFHSPQNGVKQLVLTTAPNAPEPSTMVLLGIGVAFIGATRLRQTRQ